MTKETINQLIFVYIIALIFASIAFHVGNYQKTPDHGSGVIVERAMTYKCTRDKCYTYSGTEHVERGI